MWQFLSDLEDTKVYILIPFISANNNPNEPYLILSKQILVSGYSNPIMLTKYINYKYEECYNLYGLKDNENMVLIFKYKQIDFCINTPGFQSSRSSP